LALCDVYRKARESLYEALRGCQGTNYARSRERYQWTIHSFQQKWFTKIDVSAAFHKVRINAGDE
jgi:hypothetical protein